MTAALRAVALVLVVLVAGRGLAHAQEGTGEIVLAPGEQKVLPGDGVDSYSAATSDVVEVRVSTTPDGRQQLILVGKAPGTTTVVIGLTNGRRLTYQVTVSQIRARHNVQLDVYFVQISRSRATKLGLGWPSSIAATAQGAVTLTRGAAATASLSINGSVLPRLDFAAQNGWAKVLDHTKVVMANGDEGAYSSGGDVNIQVSTGLSASLQTINFGSDIKARVSYDQTTGRVEVHLDANLSRLTDDRGTSVPGVARTKVSTTVNVALGESIALGGLYSTQENESGTGLAFLSEIPVIGYLFGTKGHSRDHLENMIFIVPTLVSPVSLADRDRVGEALRLFEGYEGGAVGADFAHLAADPPASPTKPGRRAP